MVSGMNVPEARPLISWKARTKLRSGENGSSRLESAKTALEIISSWRGPNTSPSQAEIGPISICPTVNAVVIHAPSSKPAWTAPRTSARPKLVMRPSSVEMIDPSSTARTPMKGRVVMIGGGSAARSAG